MAELLYKDEVYAIVGAAMDVYNELGAGFLESVYQEAMELELGDRGIPFNSLVPLRIKFKERVLKKTFCADLICFGAVLVELKAMDQITNRPKQCSRCSPFVPDQNPEREERSQTAFIHLPNELVRQVRIQR